jgi:hypothetical protein
VTGLARSAQPDSTPTEPRLSLVAALVLGMASALAGGSRGARSSIP